MQDAQRAVELAGHVRLGTGQVMLDSRLLHFLVDGVEVIDPLEIDCERLEALADNDSR
jgi:hypothetical protein